MLYTAEKLSNIVNVPSSTLRYWKNNLYTKWLATKNNKFTDESAAIVKEIVRLREEQKDIDEINDFLTQNYGMVEEGDSVKSLAIPQQQQLTEHNRKMEEMFSAAVIEMQKNNQLLGQLLTYLLKEKQQPPEKKIAKRISESPKKKHFVRTIKKPIVKKVKKPVKKLPPRGRGGKFKKKGFLERWFR